jgi:hypothetical protein
MAGIALSSGFWAVVSTAVALLGGPASVAVQIIRSGLARRGIVVEALPGANLPGTPAATVREVASTDRPSLDQALDAERGGDADAAWRAAERLFDAYPDVVEVQDLRCRLAKSRGLARAEVRAECAPLMQMMVPAPRPFE